MIATVALLVAIVTLPLALGFLARMTEAARAAEEQMRAFQEAFEPLHPNCRCVLDHPILEMAPPEEMAAFGAHLEDVDRWLGTLRLEEGR